MSKPKVRKRKKPKEVNKPESGQGTSTTFGITEKLLAMTFVKGLQPTEAATRLSAIGLEPSQIAPILGKTANAVRVLLSRARRR